MGIKQVIYADVLFCLNMLLGFFIVKAAQIICRSKASTFRVFSASVLAGLYSLSIFLPEYPLAVTVLFRVLFLCVETAVVFGFSSVKAFFRGFASLVGVSLLTAGLVLGVWLVFRPQGLIVRNANVYLDISFLTLVLFAAAVYTAVRLAARLRNTDSEKAECRAAVEYAGKRLELNGVVDTGNTLTDSFTGKKICVIDRTAALGILGSAAVSQICRGELPEGMHYTLTNTVSGECLLPVFSAEKLCICKDKGCFEAEHSPLAVAAADSFSNGVSILVNADFLPVYQTEKGEIANDKKAHTQNKKVTVRQKKKKCFLHKRVADSAAAADSAAGKRNYAAD